MMTKIHHLLLLLGHPGEYLPPFISTHLAHTQHNDGPTMWDNKNVARTRTRMAEVRKTQDEEATAQGQHDQDMQGHTRG